MRVAVAGSSGVLGSAVVDRLRGAGHDVVRLVRRTVRDRDEVSWDPAAGHLDPGDLRDVDAVVNLGGAGVGDRRWTAGYRRTILHSRTRPTSLLATTLAGMDDRPRALVQGTAVGWYGDRGDEVLTEAEPPGDGFLADVVVRWEAATRPAADAGLPVALMRTGVVVGPRGGAFGRLLPLIRLGLVGSLAQGRNHWPWITVPDTARAFVHAVESRLEGPVNVCAPEPAPQAHVIRAVARELHRPAVVPVPRFAMRLVAGGFADEILASQRVLPTVLRRSGFTWEHPDLASAARWLVREA